ncbi:MAG: NTPase [Aquificae bacterium]|nr:NTPase [Aquificota bacterium]
MKILLTGKPGIGKTTVVKKVAQALKDNVIGFWTEDFRDKHGKRLGFKVITTEGKEAILASKLFFDAPFKVGSYGVDIKAFEDVVIPVLEKALKENKIVVIDEIGKMELFSEKFLSLVKEIFNKKDKILATVPIKNIHPFVKELKERKDVLLIEVSLSNRNQLPEKIIQLLKN